jgi:hypothetical protein
MTLNPPPRSAEVLGDPLEPFPENGESAGAVYRRLRGYGLTESEAGDLTARSLGLRPSRRPWQLCEIQRLLFLRSLVDRGDLVD